MVVVVVVFVVVVVVVDVVVVDIVVDVDVLNVVVVVLATLKVDQKLLVLEVEFVFGWGSCANPFLCQTELI